MSLRLHDTATGTVRDFVPRVPGRVGFYLCGATVQSSPHIGHLRSAIAFDVLRRWLEVGHDLDVTFVRNVTDVDDKVLAKSAEAGQPWWAWAYRHELEFEAAYAAVGVRSPTYLPRATGHVPEMVEMVEQLIGRGHAYRSLDGGGDVWFDVRSWPGYGSLTHQRLEDVASDPDADHRGKRDPRDFALWKGHKPGEPATAAWPTPFGRGRPGWHLECSAMARRYLGPAFDLHAGGLDLRFPHHENEQAQSRAAGDDFAGLWLHNGWVRVGGQKMGKSLGNSLVVDEVLAATSPLVLRYALGTAHYRSMIDYGPQTLADAEGAVGRIEAFLRRAPSAAGGPGAVAPAALPATFPAAFRAAMDDDLNVPVALAAVHEGVRAGNRALDAGEDERAREHAAQVAAMTGVLGIDPLDPAWGGSAGPGSTAPAQAALDLLVRQLLDERTAARARRDFAAADAVRDRLAAAGVAVADTPDGATWSLAEPAPARGPADAARGV